MQATKKKKKKCGHLTKTCRKCHYRYPKGSKTRKCPKCKEPRPCTNTAMANGRCRMAGGKSLKGVASPSHQGKGLSKYLPDRLVGLYQEQEQDLELNGLKDQILLTSTRIAELLQGLDRGDSGELWKALHDAWSELEKAKTSNLAEKMADALNSIGGLIQKGYSDSSTWEELRKERDLQRKLVTAEHRRQVDMEQMVTIESLMVMVGSLMDIINTRVTDRKLKAAIRDDIGKMIPASPHVN